MNKKMFVVRTNNEVQRHTEKETALHVMACEKLFRAGDKLTDSEL